MANDNRANMPGALAKPGKPTVVSRRTRKRKPRKPTTKK